MIYSTTQNLGSLILITKKSPLQVYHFKVGDDLLSLVPTSPIWQDIIPAGLELSSPFPSEFESGSEQQMI